MPEGAALLGAGHEGALWRRIAMALRGEIEAGAFPPGARLPTEAQLSGRFGVNRHTVRRAMEDLARMGLARVEQGRGAFVPEDVLDYVVAPRTRFSEWIRRHNKEPFGRILRLERTVATRQVAAGLGVGEEAQVIVLQRLGLADGRPVSLTAHHFPARLEGLLPALATRPSITEALQSVGVRDYRRKSTRISAAMPSHEEAALLETPRSRPLLVAENTNIDSEGQIVEFSIARYPTPRVQIVVEP